MRLQAGTQEPRLGVLVRWTRGARPRQSRCDNKSRTSEASSRYILVPPTCVKCGDPLFWNGPDTLGPSLSVCNCVPRPVTCSFPFRASCQPLLPRIAECHLLIRKLPSLLSRLSPLSGAESMAGLVALDSSHRDCTFDGLGRSKCL